MYSRLIVSDRLWYRNGKKHRIRLLPAVDYGDGEVEYWVNGFNYTLENGVLFLNSGSVARVPKVIYKNGTREWHRKNGLGTELHRRDGPAVVYGNGDLECWRSGKRHGLTIISGKSYWFERGEFVKCIV